MKAIPRNLKRLHKGEEFIRRESIETIEGNEKLLAHADMIEQTMDLFDFFIRQHKACDKDDETIQLLGIRVFNGLASTLKLMLSGYHQTAVLQGRDILETVFLLDYLQTDRKAILTWRTGNKKTHKKYFWPVKIRIALDKRDGFTEKKRAAAYELFSELAGHASYKGFQLLGPQGRGANCGPFFEADSLGALLSETARLAVQAGKIFTRFFPHNTEQAIETKLNFMESHGSWYERFYEQMFDYSEIEELRTLLAAAKGK